MTIDTASVVISIVSLLTGIGLSCIAIWLSLNFYSKSKESEISTHNLLTEIKAETSQLRNINDRLFTKALNSLSHIAKQKTNSEGTLIAEQTTAAVKRLRFINPSPNR